MISKIEIIYFFAQFIYTPILTICIQHTGFIRPFIKSQSGHLRKRLYKWIANMCAAVFKWIIIIGTCFENYTLEFVSIFVSKYGMLYLISVSKLISGNIIQSALCVCPRVVSVLIIFPARFCQKHTVLIKELKMSHRFDLSTVEKG